MKLFGKRKPRSVTNIIGGLTSIITELDASITANEVEKESCDVNRTAEVERHNMVLAELSNQTAELDQELKDAVTIKSNLTTLLGLA